MRSLVVSVAILTATAVSSVSIDTSMAIRGMSPAEIARSPDIENAVRYLMWSSSEKTKWGLDKKKHQQRIETHLDSFDVAEKLSIFRRQTSADGAKITTSAALGEYAIDTASCGTQVESPPADCDKEFSACKDTCYSRFWQLHKPIPGACHLVCTMLREGCTRCEAKRESYVAIMTRRAHKLAEAVQPKISSINLSTVAWVVITGIVVSLLAAVTILKLRIDRLTQRTVNYAQQMARLTQRGVDLSQQLDTNTQELTEANRNVAHLRAELSDEAMNRRIEERVNAALRNHAHAVATQAYSAIRGQPADQAMVVYGEGGNNPFGEGMVADGLHFGVNWTMDRVEDARGGSGS